MQQQKLSLLQLQRRVSQFPFLEVVVFLGLTLGMEIVSVLPLTNTNHLCRMSIHLLNQCKSSLVVLSEGTVP